MHVDMDVDMDMDMHMHMTQGHGRDARGTGHPRLLLVWKHGIRLAMASWRPTTTLSEAEIDERLWAGAAAQGWDVQPRGELEAARRNSSWTYVEPSGVGHRKRSDAVEAFRADVDKRLWAGAAEQGWSIQPRGPRASGKWWYIDAKGTRHVSKAAASESLSQPSGTATGHAPPKSGAKRQAQPANGHAKKRPRPEQEQPAEGPAEPSDRDLWLQPQAFAGAACHKWRRGAHNKPARRCAPDSGAAARAPERCRHGQLACSARQVEVEMRDEGLVGSRYVARVQSIGQTHALVEFQAFTCESNPSELLQEWVRLEQLLPPPPPPPPEWWRDVAAGDALEFFHEDGWWEAVLRHTREVETTPPLTEFYVASLQYSNEMHFPSTHREFAWSTDAPSGLVVYAAAEPAATAPLRPPPEAELPVGQAHDRTEEEEEEEGEALAANGSAGQEEGATEEGATEEGATEEGATTAAMHAAAGSSAANGAPAGPAEASAACGAAGSADLQAEAELARERGARAALLRVAQGYRQHIDELREACAATLGAAQPPPILTRALEPLPADT